MAFLPQIQYQRLRNGLAGEITLHGLQVRVALNIGEESAPTQAPASMYSGGW